MITTLVENEGQKNDIYWGTPNLKILKIRN